MDIENIMNSDLGTGLYQIGVLILAFLFSFVSTDSFAINFIAGKMDHLCSQTSPPISENTSDAANSYHYSPGWIRINLSSEIGRHKIQECGVVVADSSSNGSLVEGLKCIQWKYDRSAYVSSIVSEFDLVCQRAWLVDLVSTFYMAGRLLSCVTHGYFSDKYGRKKVLIGSHFLKLAGGVLSLYSPNYPVFAFSRFVIAVGSTASCMASFVLLVECAGSKWRPRFGILFNCSPAIGGIVLPLVAYLVRDFRHLQTIYTWPQFILLFCYFILDESPRWLASQGRNEDVKNVFKKMAIVNKIQLVEDAFDDKAKKEPFYIFPVGSKKSKINFVRLFFCTGMFASKILATKTLILWLSWFVSCLIYYAISLNTRRLPGSVYLNTFFITLVEIPANFVTIFLVEKYGGRFTLTSSTIAAAIASFLMIPFMFWSETEYAVTAFGILSKGLITMSYNVLYVETAESYPTGIRSQAMGVSASFGRLSSMASSFIGGIMADVWRPLPSLIFGSLALISGCLFFCYPDAKTGDMNGNSSNRNIEIQVKPLIYDRTEKDRSLV